MKTEELTSFQKIAFNVTEELSRLTMQKYYLPIVTGEDNNTYPESDIITIKTPRGGRIAFDGRNHRSKTNRIAIRGMSLIPSGFLTSMRNKHKEITVSRSKSPVMIANDIISRLLTDFFDVIKKEEKALELEEMRLKKITSSVGKAFVALEELSPYITGIDRDTIKISPHFRKMAGNFRISVNGNHFEMDVRNIPIDRIEAIAKALE